MARLEEYYTLAPLAVRTFAISVGLFGKEAEARRKTVLGFLGTDRILGNKYLDWKCQSSCQTCLAANNQSNHHNLPKARIEKSEMAVSKAVESQRVSALVLAPLSHSC